MPRSGRFRELDAGIPEERKALARALRSLMRVVGLSLRQTHAELERLDCGCDTSASALSDLLNARIHKPKREVIRALYELAETVARTGDASMPVTRGELEDLRAKACEPCGGFVCGLPAHRVAGPLGAGGPATRGSAVAPALALLDMKQNRRAEDVRRRSAARRRGGQAGWRWLTR